MKISKKLKDKKFFIIIAAFFLLLTVGIVGREYLIQRNIDRCYLEAEERYQEALKEVPKVQVCPEGDEDSTWHSVFCEWIDDPDVKIKLKEQLGEDEARCLRRYR